MIVFRRSPTPESPKPYVPPKARTIFPVLLSPPLPVTATNLPQLIKEFNAKHNRTLSLRVCLSSPNEPRNISPPVLLRLSIPDVLKAYIIIDAPLGEEEDRPIRERHLLVENITFFGSREKV
jgi:hypothetical protein